MIPVGPDDAVPECFLLMRHPCQRQHVLGDQFPEREVGLIRRRRAPGFHGVPSFEEPPDLVVECALPSAAGKVVPNGDPHMHNSRCVLTRHLVVQDGEPAPCYDFMGAALCYMTAVLEDSLLRGSMTASGESECGIMAPPREGGPRPHRARGVTLARVSASATVRHRAAVGNEMDAGFARVASMIARDRK